MFQSEHNAKMFQLEHSAKCSGWNTQRHRDREFGGIDLVLPLLVPAIPRSWTLTHRIDEKMAHPYHLFRILVLSGL
jgi:hypothetical protein